MNALPTTTNAGVKKTGSCVNALPTTTNAGVKKTGSCVNALPTNAYSLSFMSAGAQPLPLCQEPQNDMAQCGQDWSEPIQGGPPGWMCTGPTNALLLPTSTWLAATQSR